MLAPFRVDKQTPAEGEKNWIGGYPTWVIAWRPEVNGHVTVDVVDAPWPDNMGDPKSPGGQSLFAAWSMGFMGPMTWPGNLLRAIQYTEAFGDKAAADGAKKHRAFVRIRSTYVLGSDDDAKVMPDDYQARPELEFVTSVAAAVAAAPGVLLLQPGRRDVVHARRTANHHGGVPQVQAPAAAGVVDGPAVEDRRRPALDAGRRHRDGAARRAGP